MENIRHTIVQSTKNPKS